MSITQFQKITPEKALEQFHTLVTIDVCARASEMACLSLDMRFKNPNINNHIKRIKESVKFIQTQLKTDPKYGFSVKDEDYTFDAVGEIYECLTLLPMFGKEGIAALNENLKEQIKNAKENIQPQRESSAA